MKNESKHGSSISSGLIRWMGATAIVALVACDPGGVDDPCVAVDSDSATLELGNSKPNTAAASGFEYVPVEDGGTLTLWEGPQGGFHVWGAVRTTNIYPGTKAEQSGEVKEVSRIPTTSYQLVTTSTLTGMPVVEADKTFEEAFVGSAESAEYLHHQVILNTREGGLDAYLALEGRAAIYTATVTDTCGTEVNETLSVTLDVLSLEEQQDL